MGKARYPGTQVKAPPRSKNTPKPHAGKPKRFFKSKWSQWFGDRPGSWREDRD